MCLTRCFCFVFFFFFSSRRRHTRCLSDWSSDVCSSDLGYDQTPAHMARLIGEFASSGLVNLVGGCCGTTRSEERRVGKEWRSRWSPYLLTIQFTLEAMTKSTTSKRVAVASYSDYKYDSI